MRSRVGRFYLLKDESSVSGLKMVKEWDARADESKLDEKLKRISQIAYDKKQATAPCERPSQSAIQFQDNSPKLKASFKDRYNRYLQAVERPTNSI